MPITESTLDNHPTIALACELIKRKSITPKDQGCQQLMCERLEALGFTVHSLRFGDVDNFWAVYGSDGPLFAFLGHTDVVPPGPASEWHTDPFLPTINDGLLYGRGAADMKGSLAAMLTATERFLDSTPQLNGRLAFLVTSDEEGIAVDGTVKVVDWLETRGEKIDFCLVGEPSSTASVGDVIKNGRRGSIGCELTLRGKQGHVAYPHLAANPIHMASSVLAELHQITWDKGNQFFPPTSFQVSNINSGTGATNVIPGETKIVFNFRFSTAVTDTELQQKTEAIIAKHCSDYTAVWRLSGQAFITEKGKLIEAVQQAIVDVTGKQTNLSTAGGTSDGRFIAPTGSQVVELGPVNATIHKVNECVDVQELVTLDEIYFQTLTNLLG